MTLAKAPLRVNRFGVGPVRVSAADFITEHVLRLIREGGLQAGDRLPTVDALSRRLSVAPPTMREAMRRLEALGVVEMRHGSGTYVLEGAFRMVLPNPDPGPLASETVIELLDARILIEPRLAQLAAERGTTGEFIALESLLGEAGSHLSGDDNSLQELNLGFHRAIARIAGNRILSQVVDSILDLYAGEQLLIMQLFNDRRGDHQHHLQILAGLRGRSPARAGQLMREHLVEIRTVMQGRLRPTL
ncbi:MAG: FadR family transcriptional regulator [Candidatus Dormibacteraeota bacterium]|uniref:FadR family transcriptional regulator n=1 Tax=Candidatus Dormiibacter inghamiae TaxID=3127013 RepID=A0A934NH94_9BACT|nr:FadR family transcriptional regulator [Candidatus Dormibacteraeota bacterium]MBJ7607655.1 FadR family transcriptional regulator [Candidatus Dormibacteraeota bacterium]